ncbi:MAG: recombinase family protein [Myxococcales bacterium]|nr:recombinase family protein [Myxococcales bacterium]
MATKKRTKKPRGAYVGYARVSTADQNLRAQLKALREAGCEKLFSDKASGASERPGFRSALEYLRPGDTLVVWKFDRAFRSLSHMVATAGELRERGVGFVSLTEAVDTASPAGRMFFHMLAALAEFERDLISERTQAGLRAARARGHSGGRRRKLDATGEKLARQLYEEGHRATEIGKRLGVSRATVYRALAAG